VLGQAYLCQTKTEARASWLKPGSQKTAWGNGTEHFQEISIPNKQGQWIVFNADETLVGVITVFPGGVSLDDYPTLRKTLSQLPPAREFYLTSSQLLEGQVPDSATLYRTGKANTTHQYYTRHRPGQDDQLIMAIFVLDPYEALLDGNHPRFLSYLNDSASRSVQNTAQVTPSSSTDKDFLGLQQFARGEISLFASCGTQHPDIAQDAYKKTIQYGLSEAKQLAEAHHRLGLALSHLEKFAEAQTSIEAALTIQPHTSNILNSYGTVLVKLEKIPAGIQAYEQALALQPAYAKARFNLAAVFESINPKRAIQEYETFIVLAEDNPDEITKVAVAKTKIKTLQR
jgi:tetratricopeptide (TPR) repeat protein